MLCAASSRIGVFDSGIGGLSVLRAVRARLPGADLTYIADTRHTPWGDRPAAWVTARCQQLAGWLIHDGCDLVLVACNTGTTQAIAALRAHWPQQQFVGVEPGVKPAVAASRNHRVAVMATSGTLRSPRLRKLVDQHAGGATVVHLPCPGLADAIEAAGADPVALEARLDAIAADLRASGADTVVLGCTHYPLVADTLARRLGDGVVLIDTADAVARRVQQLVGGPEPASATGRLRLLATDRPQALQQAARRWLGGTPEAALLDLDGPGSPRP